MRGIGELSKHVTPGRCGMPKIALQEKAIDPVKDDAVSFITYEEIV